MTMAQPVLSLPTRRDFSASILYCINDTRLLVATLMLFALGLNREGDRVPSGNELVYLLYFFKAWHHSFLSTDWTFQETTAGHAVFNYAAGWLTLLMPLEAAGWVGRIGCWLGVFTGLFRLGARFRLEPWAVWVGLLLWMAEGQSLVTKDWMIGSFEAKCIAYIFLLYSIDAVLDGRMILGGVLCGLCFSFHSAVGLWSGIALGFAILIQCPIRDTIRFSVATILFSLPGLITSLPLIAGPHPITEPEAKYWVTVALPDCFDPFTFPTTWLVLMGAILVFAGLYAWRWRDDRGMRLLFVFELVLAVFFYLGVVGRVAGRFTFVEMFPMRCYAVIGLLLFFWQLISLIQTALLSTSQRRSVAPLLIVGLLLFCTLPSPVLQVRDMVMNHLSRFQQITTGNLSPRGNSDANFRAAADWIANHTPVTDIVIAPPWRTDGFYYLRRPLVANWHAPRYDAMTEWRERNESLVGDVSRLTAADSTDGNMDAEARLHYQQLSAADIQQIRKQYGGKWLVTTGQYSYPVRFSAGDYSVYQLP
jgi:hypothetical protein